MPGYIAIGVSAALLIFGIVLMIKQKKQKKK